VDVCVAQGHDALSMMEKCENEIIGGEVTLDRYRRDIAFFKSLPPTPIEYRNEKALADLMLGENAWGFVGGAGSCSGCGEGTVVRMLMAATLQVYGPESMGIVAETGCNSVFGSTYPYNPFTVPWTNSLFENGPADAMGIRMRWDQAGHPERRLWVFGGDGAMYDIGFQSLSRLLASGMNVKIFVLDTQVYSNTGGQALQNPDTQHARKCPKLSYRQRRDLLIGLHKDCSLRQFELTLAVSCPFPCHSIDTWDLLPFGLIQFRQLIVITFRETFLDLVQGLLDNVKIVQHPFAGMRKRQISGRCGSKNCISSLQSLFPALQKSQENCLLLKFLSYR
jgi:hypothetical protein